MTKKEFIGKHGKQAWEKLVPVRTSEPWPQALGPVAAFIVDLEIKGFLVGHGLVAQGLVQAEAEYVSLGQPESWEQLLTRTLYSSAFLEERLKIYTRIFEHRS